MSNVSSGRKKTRTKESSKSLLGSRSDRARSSVFQSTSITLLEDASVTALSDAPYVCTGRFGVDFVQLCRRANLYHIPNVVARPHRPRLPSAAPVVDEKKNIVVRKPSARLAQSIQMSANALTDQLVASDAAAEGYIPEPPPKTYTLRDAASFFRPSVQVCHFIARL